MIHWSMSAKSFATLLISLFVQRCQPWTYRALSITRELKINVILFYFRSSCNAGYHMIHLPIILFYTVLRCHQCYRMGVGKIFHRARNLCIIHCEEYHTQWNMLSSCYQSSINSCDYLSKLGLKLNHVSKGGPLVPMKSQPPRLVLTEYQ